MASALGATVGSALLLDDELRIVLASEQARELLGFDVPIGAAAAKVLCANSPKRMFAAALAEGRPAGATIVHPAASDRTLNVRALPLRPAERVAGWLVLMEEGATDGDGPVCFHGMWSQSPNMREVFRLVERVAPGEASVLLRGETGTGKELVAHAIHALSARSAGPFRAINCAALPAALLESELFGHVRGAFTGAVSEAKGHFQLAHRGTLFLDEVGEMPLELQAKLLRVLETRTVLPIGAQKPVVVDVRIVSATHRALRHEVERGRFRADLMYRLRVIPIFLPPLRERREDIPLLCSKLIEGMNQSSRRRIEAVAPSARALLSRHDWPGNVRELINALEYAYAIGDGPLLAANHLPPELLDRSLAPGVSQIEEPESHLSEEARQLLDVLERAGGNKNRAAKILGVSRVTLWRRLRAVGLEAMTEDPVAEPGRPASSHPVRHRQGAAR